MVRIEDAKEARTALGIIGRWIKQIKKQAQDDQIELVHPDFFEDLKEFKTKLKELNSKLAEAINNNEFEEFAQIKLLVFELRTRFAHSKVIENYKDYRMKVALDVNKPKLVPRLSKDSILTSKEFTEAKESLIQTLNSEYEETLRRKAESIQTELSNQYEMRVNELESMLHQRESELLVQNSKIQELSAEVQTQSTKISSLEEELKTQTADLEELTDFINSASESVLQLLTQKTGVKLPADRGELNIELDLSSSSHKEFVWTARHSRLPPANRLYIDRPQKVHPAKEVGQFLTNSAPPVNVFVFGWSASVDKDVSVYVPALEKAIPRATKEVVMDLWIFSKDALQRVVRASCKADFIRIGWSQLDLEEDLDFSGPLYSTTYICLSSCGYHSDWGKKPERLERLVKACSACSLKQSLATLDVYN